MKDYLYKVQENGPSWGPCKENVTESELGYIEPRPLGVDGVELAGGFVLIPSLKSEGGEHWLPVDRQSITSTGDDELFEFSLAIRKEASEKSLEEIDHDQLIRQWCEFGLETHSRKKKLEGDSSHCFC